MPHATVNGISLYYEVHGTGEPLILIHGIGYPCEMWFAQIPVLSKEFKTIIFDNRGTGRSDKPDLEYTILQMAQDACGLLDHLQIGAARVIGLSMGGLIAQEMAISSPQRVRKLVLISTHFGTGYWEATQSLWEQILTVSAGQLEEILREKMRYAVTPEFYQKQAEIIGRMVMLRCTNPQPPHAFIRQFEAAKKFDAKERVKQVSAPTLVISGTEDQIVPIAMARRLAEGIPNALFKEIKGAAHLAFIEKADEVNRIILEFLR